jgi:hypothetical protein
MLPVEQPFKTYTGLDGKPLDNGYVYFGQPGQDPVAHPVTVYWDAAGTLPATQPLRTVNGYIVNESNAPANVFYEGLYSELVRDSKSRQVFYSQTSGEFSIATVVSNFLSDIGSAIGASLIGFMAAGVGAIKRWVQDKLREHVSVLDFDGVDPTGATDSTDGINKAIASMPAAGGRVEFPLGGVFKISGPIVGKTNVVLKGYGAGRDTSWTGVTLLATSATACLDFRDCDHYRIEGIRFDGANLAPSGLLQGYKTGSVHVAHARTEDFVVQRVTGTAIDTGSGNPAGATNDCTYRDVIIEGAGIGYDWYSTNNLVFGGVVAGCTSGGSRHNTSSEAKFYGTVFSGNKADHVLAGDDFVNGFSCFGNWYETSTDGIIKRYHVPSIANYVGKILFDGCNLATSAANLFDLTNCQARVTIVGSRRDAASASTIVAPAGNSILAIELLDDVTITGGGVLSKINVDGFACDLAHIFGDNLAGRALPGNATTTGAAIVGWNKSGGEGEMNLIGAKGGGGLGGVSLGVWDGAVFKHLLWPTAGGAVFVANSTAVPGGAPVGGGYFIVSAGALYWRGSSGTETLLAPA